MTNAAHIQAIYDQAEIIIDNLDIGLACLAALEAALIQQGAPPAPVIAAIRRYLEEARAGADRIARLAMKLP
ncbi:hypothetical protein SAMN04488021_1022 [Paracoccus aminovorans]|uniref:Uncharacterized protein n=1 Tax=Paracoccus aminovorans TaxID=34004 RepID=A0A1I2XPJ6_9RHOB|nr:hypothetical protein [Paracoccus aminovorans]CQR87335.1 hypothetical protein JCM7685_2792 [Paracoccus aminovorans]SFH14969.1 hypothetical protein SAMN04488021_1022 [Paracoccus aminovorans]